MLLERRLVKILNNYNIYKGLISLDNFIDYVLKIKWPRINYFYYRDGIFRRIIKIAIDDCIAYEFIINENNNLKVTNKGRDHIKLLGFVEEFLKRRKRTIVNTSSFIFGGLITYLVSYFLHK